MHTHKQIICVRDVTADAEQLHKIVKLAVDIATYLPQVRSLSLSLSQPPPPGATPPNTSAQDQTKIAYCYRRVDRDHVPLLDEQLPRLVAQLADFGLGYRSARAQLGDGPVKTQKC